MGRGPVAGQELGSFTLVRELARGGMGAVWIAESRTLGRRVAIKVLLEGASPEVVARFEIEARTSARLRHPNVVGVHEVGRSPAGHPFLVMDLVEGESLRGSPEGVA